jgi:orotate phosphoribosyltransferase
MKVTERSKKLIRKYYLSGKDNKGERGFDEEGYITLRSGARSDWYIDAKSMLLDSNCDEIIYELYSVITKAFDYNYPAQILGIGYGGAILVGALTAARYCNGLIGRSEKKEHGLKNSLIGNPICKEVIIVDDVFTTGSSVRQAIQIANKYGLEVKAIVAIVDRYIDPFDKELPVNIPRKLTQFDGIPLYSIVNEISIREILDE